MNPQACHRIQSEEIQRRAEEQKRKDGEIDKLVPKEFEKLKQYIAGPDFVRDIRTYPYSKEVIYGERVMDTNINQNSCNVYRRMAAAHPEYNGFKFNYFVVGEYPRCGVRISWK